MRTDIELLRIISAVGIIWFHSGETFGKQYAYSGLIFFVITSAYFSVSSSKKYTLYDRAKRVLVPYIFWAVVYGAINMLFSKPFFSEKNPLICILGASAPHLWYLPFIFAVFLITDNTKTLIRSKYSWIIFLICTAALLLTAKWWRSIPYFYPFSQYLHVLPAIFIGLILGSKKYIKQQYIVLSFGIILTCTLIPISQKISGVGLAYFTGCLISTPFLFSKSILPKSNFILFLGTTTLGVYLLHPLLLSALSKLHVDGIKIPLIASLLAFIIIGICKKYCTRLPIKLLI